MQRNKTKFDNKTETVNSTVFADKFKTFGKC